jgi:hypothetical protein
MKHRQFQNKRNYFGSQARISIGLDSSGSALSSHQQNRPAFKNVLAPPLGRNAFIPDDFIKK